MATMVVVESESRLVPGERRITRRQHWLAPETVRRSNLDHDWHLADRFLRKVSTGSAESADVTWTCWGVDDAALLSIGAVPIDLGGAELAGPYYHGGPGCYRLEKGEAAARFYDKEWPC